MAVEISHMGSVKFGLYLGLATQLRPNVFVGRDAELEELSRLPRSGSGSSGH